MNISYLPEVTNPTGDTSIPLVVSGAPNVSKKVTLSSLNQFSGPGTVASVLAGENVQLTPSPAITASVISFSFPGALFPYPSDNIPTGWLFCNGQAVSRQVYTNLFQVIGVSYGAGDNRSTFNLPDLRGRTVFGLETMGGVSSSGRLTNSRPGNVNGGVLGAVGGEEAHVLTTQETGLNPHGHTHGVSITWGGFNEEGNRCNGGDGNTSGKAGSGYNLTWNYSFTNDAAADSSATAHPNLPPLVFLNWIIKY